MGTPLEDSGYIGFEKKAKAGPTENKALTDVTADDAAPTVPKVAKKVVKPVRAKAAPKKKAAKKKTK